MKITDLEICEAIAIIDNVSYIKTKYKDKPNFIALISHNDFSGTPPEMIGQYNPLTNDALCFRFCHQDDIYVTYTGCPAGTGKAYFAVKNGMQTDYQSTPNMAVCLAKLGIFSEFE